MPAKAAKMPATPVEWRIGEVAKLTGVTTRTLRYWEELELLQPSSYRPSGERLYPGGGLARALELIRSFDLRWKPDPSRHDAPLGAGIPEPASADPASPRLFCPRFNDTRRSRGPVIGTP